MLLHLAIGSVSLAQQAPSPPRARITGLRSVAAGVPSVARLPMVVAASVTSQPASPTESAELPAPADVRQPDRQGGPELAPPANADRQQAISERLDALEQRFDAFDRPLASPPWLSYPTAGLTGFAQLDTYGISQQEFNQQTVGNGQNAVGFRRARLAAIGQVTPVTNYMLEVDFAALGRPSFFNVWGEQTNLPLVGTIRLGQYIQPVSADALSDFRDLPFLERSLPFLAFVPFFRVGVEAYAMADDELSQWACSVFSTGGLGNSPLDDNLFATNIGDQGGVSFAMRATRLLWYDDPSDGRYLWHVGGSFDYSVTTGKTASGTPRFYQSRVLPEFGPLGSDLPPPGQSFGPAAYNAAGYSPPIFIDSGQYRASDFAIFGAETIWQAGPWSVQSEFLATDVLSVAGPIWYTGAYAEVMYRLTGEQRVYNKQLGVLRNPIPFTDFLSLGRQGVRGWGAWEVASRVSYVDIRNPGRLRPTDYLNGSSNIGNGTLVDTTLGLTWFLNRHVKVQFNWIHMLLDNVVTGSSQADAFVGRFQFDF